MKKAIYTLIGIILSAPLVAFAINITVPSAPSKGYFLVSTTTGAYIATTTDPAHFGFIFATSTTANNFFSGTLTISTTTLGCASFSNIGLLFSTGVACGTGSGSGSDPFSHTTNFGVNTSATTSPIWFQGTPFALFASSTSWFDGINIGSSTTTNATSTSFAVSNLSSALIITNSTGSFANYSGTTCTNQFVRILSALGAATCATVSASDVSLANLTATDGTLTFSGTYNGATARTIGINLSNANTWTGVGTTTFNNGVSTGGLASSQGLTITGGIIKNTSVATSTFVDGLLAKFGSFWNGIEVAQVISTSTATSTFTGGISTSKTIDVQSTSATSTFANGIRLVGGGLTFSTLGTCGTSNALTTDSSGNVVCGAISSSLAAIAANSVLANQTSASAVPTALATSSIYSGAGSLGVGTTSAWATLSVNASSQTSPYFAIGSSTARVFDILPSANAAYGIGTSTLFGTPLWATLSITGVTSVPPLAISTTSTTNASTTLFMVDKAGDIHLGGGTPTLTSCGTTPALDADSTDQAGTITFGATASGCTLTFSTAKTSSPHCPISPRAISLVNAYTVAITSSAITITQAASGGTVWDYVCALGH